MSCPIQPPYTRSTDAAITVCRAAADYGVYEPDAVAVQVFKICRTVAVIQNV